MSDLILGAVLLAIFLVLVFAAGLVHARLTTRGVAQTLEPLVPVIGGALAGNGTQRWLTGHYGGRRVLAAAVPGVAIFSGEGGGERYNAFDVEVQEVAGATDWMLTYGAQGPGEMLSGAESWRFITRERALGERLRASPIITEVERFGGAGVRGAPTVRYSSAQKSLLHRDNVSPQLAPDPAHFERQVALAVRLAAISEEVNHGAG